MDVDIEVSNLCSFQGSVQQHCVCCIYRLFRASSSAYLLINSAVLEGAYAEGLVSYAGEVEEILGCFLSWICSRIAFGKRLKGQKWSLVCAEEHEPPQASVCW